jgi:hypothetical protein
LIFEVSVISVNILYANKSDRLILANLATESSHQGKNLIAIAVSFLLQISRLYRSALDQIKLKLFGESQLYLMKFKLSLGMQNLCLTKIF